MSTTTIKPMETPDVEVVSVAEDASVECVEQILNDVDNEAPVSESDVAIEEPVEAIPVNAPNSVAFHRNGLALVTRNLALPMGASNAAYASAGGLGVRVVYDYDASTKTDKVSFDVIYGIQALDSDLICKLVG